MQVIHSLPPIPEADAAELRLETEAIRVAMAKAHQDAILLHRQKNLPLVERRDGVIVFVNPFTLEIMADGEVLEPRN